MSIPHSTPPALPASSANRITRGHSCVACQKRKVRCNGQRPCATCIKSGDECASARLSTPFRARAARASASTDRLASRLKRCEDLLLVHGTKMEEFHARDAPAPALHTDVGQMIVEHGHSRYVENKLWKELSNELQDTDDLPELVGDDPTLLVEHLPATGESLLLGRQRGPSLSALHPTVPHIFWLWQTCLDNVNALVKIFHAPSIQQMILEAVKDLKNIPKSIEALMFAIYLASVVSMNDQDCRSLMGEPKAALLARFSNATQQALVNAEFLKSTNLVILQALTLFLLTTRQLYDSQSQWLLTGVASRIGQAMGLHREGSLRGISPFETEIRRRLWWQILIMDGRSAQLSGAAMDAHFHLVWDTKRPLNVNDSDLSPSMREPPAEHDGTTEMLFCSIRFEIGGWMRQMKNFEKDGPVSTAKQNRVIDELENRLEQGFLAKCDPSIPFHLLAIYLARSAICQMRLSAHDPQRYSNERAGLSQDEKDRLFALGLQAVVYDNLTYSNKQLERYRWHVTMHFPFEAFILVLTELVTRVEGEAIDQAWMEVTQVYENHPELIIEASKALYYAMGNLMLRAWDKRVVAARDQRPPYQPVEPPSISKLRAQRRSKALQTTQSSYSGAVSPELQASHGYNVNDAREDTSNSLELSSHAHLPMDTADLDWAFWQDLLDGRGTLSFDGHEPHSYVQTNASGAEPF